MKVRSTKVKVFTRSAGHCRVLAEMRAIGRHDHRCAIYESDEQRDLAAATFLQVGLGRGERCLYVADTDGRNLLKILESRGANVNAAVKSGRLTVLNKQQAYLRSGGHFDPDAMISFLGDVAKAANAAGSVAWLLAGDMTWAQDAATSEPLIEYEAKLNVFLRRNDAAILCLYDCRRFRPEVLLKVLRTHPVVIYGNFVCKNPYYVPPEELLAAGQPQRELQHLLNNIASYTEMEESLHHLSAGLLRSQDEERRRIALALHETVVQSLVALKMNLAKIGGSDFAKQPSVASLFQDSSALVEASVNEARTLSHLLYPPLLQQAGLAAALRWYAGGFEERSGVKVTLEVPADLERLPEEIETTVFRMVQEGLTNIHRHSGSAVARIRIIDYEDSLKVEIEDEGHGMPRGALRQGAPLPFLFGVGIAGMRERVKQLGGRMDIHSDEHGTKLTAILPVNGGSLWQKSAS